MTNREDGFSLIEAVLAALMALVVAAVVLALAGPGRDAVIAQPEAADMQQRLRVAADSLYKDLLMAGAGTYGGPQTGPLVYFFAPMLPFRAGLKNPDPPGVVRTDAFTIFYVPSTAAQASIATAGPSAAIGSVDLNADAACPSSMPACGFQSGMNALIFEGTGLHDVFAVTGVLGPTLTLQANTPSLSFAGYPSGTAIAEVVSVMVLAQSRPGDSIVSARTNRRRQPGGPCSRSLSGFDARSFGDPQPPRLTGKPLDDPSGPWTTYGPPPPKPGEQGPTGGYPPGESCVFAVDPVSGTQVPRLPTLGMGTGGLSHLSASQLTDGPWCPDDSNPNRWDADLLRIRSVAVTLRIQSANAALRGPVGVLFASGGTSTNAARWLPDVQSTFRVMPRNLNPKALNGW